MAFKKNLNCHVAHFGPRHFSPFVAVYHQENLPISLFLIKFLSLFVNFVKICFSLYPPKRLLFLSQMLMTFSTIMLCFNKAPSPIS